MRLLNVTAFCFAVASAFLLYSLNYETRHLEAQIQGQERAAQKAKSDIAVLKAERSHLSRPERIDPLARQLGLMPPRPDQLVAPDVAAAIAVTGKAPVALRRLAESE
ncbi:MAG: cell division protein FtsL [Hyphomicrobium sp.]|nr:cell division protein FtsL [Hyphomicrobium sp.]